MFQLFCGSLQPVKHYVFKLYLISSYPSCQVCVDVLQKMLVVKNFKYLSFFARFLTLSLSSLVASWSRSLVRQPFLVALSNCRLTFCNCIPILFSPVYVFHQNFWHFCERNIFKTFCPAITLSKAVAPATLLNVRTVALLVTFKS